jgi:hypothetical protein
MNKREVAAPMSSPPPDRSERRLLPIEEARYVLGNISRAKLYEEIAAGRLRLTRIGSRTFVDSRELDRYMDALTAA